ncbi:MAG: 2-C-methyl-D-erythritol 4-phosphate cytidylyltransferase [Lachnospiraceae bacterium]|nr:2-C-methyl-D-erythritol 4-phosphate cytidylyltransferase [Lachnospiraceae bacterium]
MSYKKCTAIVLAAGKGKRMNSTIQKQYLPIMDKPVLYYSLKAFEESFIEDIIIVTSEDEIGYIKENIVKKYNFSKVLKTVAGGRERYHSVAAGLEAVSKDTGYVFIHDSARPFIDGKLLERAYETVSEYHTAVAAMPVKDTIKVADDKGIVTDTPDRSTLYIIQTPQVFDHFMIKEAYRRLIEDERKGVVFNRPVTDDAMVMERYGSLPVKLYEGSYRNIKITTKEDMLTANAIATYF